MRTSRPFATLITAAALLVGGAGAATADSTVVTDPHGDSPSRDIHRVAVVHTDRQVQVRLDQDLAPDLYYLRVDVPGGRKWDHMVIWSWYYQRTVTIKTRAQFEAGEGSNTCQLHTSTTPGDSIQLRVPRSCLGDPERVRVQTFAYDEDRGIVDKTATSDWVRAG